MAIAAKKNTTGVSVEDAGSSQLDRKIDAPGVPIPEQGNQLDIEQDREQSVPLDSASSDSASDTIGSKSDKETASTQADTVRSDHENVSGREAFKRRFSFGTGVAETDPGTRRDVVVKPVKSDSANQQDAVLSYEDREPNNANPGRALNSIVDDEIGSLAMTSAVERKRSNMSVKSDDVMGPPSSYESVVSAYDAVPPSYTGRSTEASASADSGNSVLPRSSEPPVSYDLPSYRFSSSASRNKDRAKKGGFIEKLRMGFAVTDKMIGSRFVKPGEVSVGSDIIEEVLRQPKDKFLSLIESETGVSIDPSSPDAIQQIMSVVNNPNNNIMVSATKSPVNLGSSHQGMILRIHLGRGIKVHPLAAKSFNADFDGDDMTVSFDKRAIKRIKKFSSYLIDIDGNATIDPDFFPITRLTGSAISEADALAFINDALLSQVTNVDKSDLAKSILALCDETESEIVQSRMNDFAREVWNVASKYGNADVMVSNILDAVYNGLRQLKLVKAEFAFVNNPDDFVSNVPVVTQADNAIEWILDDMHSGNPPMNFQEFKKVMNKFIGEAGGKNVAFRLTADVAKMIRYDGRLSISSESDMKKVYEQTMAAGVSMQISGQVHMGDAIEYASSIVRTHVIGKVGFPNDPRYENLSQFIDAFAYEYQRIERLVNIANTQFLQDLSISGYGNQSVTKLSGRTAGAVAQPLIDVYGSFTLDKMFNGVIGFDGKVPKGTIDRKKLMLSDKDKGMTLSEFSRNNRHRFSQDEIRKVQDTAITGTNDYTLTKALIASIADKKTSGASALNRELMDKMLPKMKVAIDDLNRILSNRDDVTEWREWAQDLTELLYATDPDLFMFFNMDSPNTFVNSRYGRAILAASADTSHLDKDKDKEKIIRLNKESVDRLGGIMLSMVIEFRIAKINGLKTDLDNRISSNTLDEQIASVAIAKHDAELEALSESSLAWSSIVKEIRSRDTAFKKLSNGEAIADPLTRGAAVLCAPKYWENPRHNSILEVLLDETVGKEEKENILADIVRFNEKYVYINSFEMTYQLRNGMHGTKKGLLKDIKDASAGFDSYAKRNLKSAVDNVNKAYDEYGNVDDALMQTLKCLDADPYALVDINEDIFSDAICAQLDKEYHQSEKSRQAGAVDAMYNAVSLQRSGGVYSDVDRVDLFALGMELEDQISIKDIVHVLADSEASIDVCTRTGQVATLSRDELCRKNNAEEKDVWQFLLSHPRIAMAIRPHHVTCFDGRTSLAASGSMSDAIANRRGQGHAFLGKAKSILRDQPRFWGMVSMMVPAHGEVARNLRGKYKTSERKMRDAIVDLAFKVREENLPGASIDFVRNYLGVTPEAIAAKEVDEKIASSLYSELVWNIDKAVSAIATAIPNGVKKPRFDPDESYAGSFDFESIAMYYDVKQDFSGSKTAMSTRIEGQETYNLALWMALLSPEDKYDSINDLTEDDVIEQLRGCQTSLGVAVGEMSLDEMMELSDGEDIVVEVPDGFKVKDNLTDNQGRPVSSVARFLLIKRDSGAERFNLKIKKFGDDGTNSITKHGKLENVDPLLYSRIEQSYRDFGLFQAKVTLAEFLQERNEALGYKDMTLANYMCLADLMLVEVSGDVDDGSGNTSTETTFVIRSIKQLAYTIKYNMPADVLRNGNPNDLREEARRIASETGFERVPIETVLGRVRVHGSSSFKPVARHRASHFDRNASLVKKITLRAGFIPRTEKEEKAISKNLLNKHKGVRSSLKNLFEYSFMGIIGEDAVENIGPRNLWILKNGTRISDKQLDKDIERAKLLGITVLVEDPDLLVGNSARYKGDLIPAPGAYGFILPFFDMELNGSAADPWVPRTAVFQANSDDVMWTYEDLLNEYGLGDAQFQSSNSLIERMNPIWSDRTEISAMDIFSDTMSFYGPDATYQIEIAEETDIRKFVVNQFPEPFEIDYGVKDGDFDIAKARMDQRIEEYRQTYSTSGKNGWLRQSKPDRIVGWLRCTVIEESGETHYVFAPVIPFASEDSLNAPTEYEINQYSYGNGKFSDLTICIDWLYNGDVANMYFKMHEGAGAANKMTGTGNGVDMGTLANGRPIDGCYAAESTQSRRMMSNRRLSTMDTLMFAARDSRHTNGYNFGSAPGAFPGNPEIADALKSYPMPESFWLENIPMTIENGTRKIDPGFFSSDPEIDAFLRNQIAKCFDIGLNPSYFLASEFDGRPTNVYWEFPMLYETGWGYMNSWLKFMNMMNPDLCAESLDGDWSGKLFRPCAEKGDNFGCLQMRIPHTSESTGNVFYTWENVYAGWSFFGRDYSGFSKPNINGSSDTMESLNTYALQGRVVGGDKFRHQVEWAASDIPQTDMQYAPQANLEAWIKEMSNGDNRQG